MSTLEGNTRVIIVKKWRLDHKSKGFIWADLLISGAEWFVVLFFCCRGGTSPCKHVNLWLFDMNQESYVFIKHSLLPRSLSLSAILKLFFSLLCFVLAVYSLCNLHCFLSLSLSLYLPPLPSSLPPFLPLSLWCVLQRHVTWRPHMARACERQRERFQNMQSEHSWLALPPPALLSLLPPSLPPSLPPCAVLQSAESESCLTRRSPGLITALNVKPLTASAWHYPALSFFFKATASRFLSLL